MWPWAMTLSLDCQGLISKSYLGWPIDMEWKECKSIGSKGPLWLWTLTSPMTLTLDFQGQILIKLYLRNGRIDWHGMKVIWVDRMLSPLCDLDLWCWPWTSKVILWNNHVPRMGGMINMEQKGCEPIRCWTHYVTLTFNLVHGFSRLNLQIIISQEW